MNRELFVYWHVTFSHAEAASNAAAAMQVALCAAHPGLVARLYRRADLTLAQATLMETYAHPQGVGLDLQQHLDRLALAALGSWVVGARHTEVFERLPTG
jgi:hypothetical protein